MLYYFIVNPNAGGGKGLKVWNRLKRLLSRRHVSYEAFFTASSGDARSKVRELTERMAEELCIITVGGDGTLNEVLDGISLSTPVILGMIPAGTGNDFSRSMRLSKNSTRLMTHYLTQGRLRTLDYGVLSCAENGCIRRFLISSGIGLDAAVCHDLLNREMQGGVHRGGLSAVSYLIMGLRELMFARPTKGYLLLDGTRKVEFNSILFVSAHIQPYEGGGFRFAPAADPGDGQLEICVVSSRNKFGVAQQLLRSRRKTLRETAGVHFFSCREAHIHTDMPLAVHADGESCRYQTDIDVRCVPGQVRFLI